MIGWPGWLSGLFQPRVQLTTAQQERLHHWQALPASELRKPLAETRCVVLDVETSGLNLRHDRLISIGAVAIENGLIALSESFTVVLQQQEVSGKDNILLHEIGGTEQRQGISPAEGLLDFLEFVRKDPLVAFHVTFDRTMIQRAIRQYLGFSLRHPWLDLAHIMPAMHPEQASRLRSLDDWTGKHAIRNEVRHNAQSDAYATAQLLLVCLAQARHKNITSFEGMLYLEKLHRTLHDKY